MTRRLAAAGVRIGPWADVRVDATLGTPQDADESATALLEARSTRQDPATQAEEAAGIIGHIAAGRRAWDLRHAADDGPERAA